jgi:hypothetical protein
LRPNSRPLAGTIAILGVELAMRLGKFLF